LRLRLRLSEREAESTRRRQGLLVGGEELQQLELLSRREPRGVLDRPLAPRRRSGAGEGRHGRSFELGRAARGYVAKNPVPIAVLPPTASVTPSARRLCLSPHERGQRRRPFDRPARRCEAPASRFQPLSTHHLPSGHRRSGANCNLTPPLLKRTLPPTVAAHVAPTPEILRLWRLRAQPLIKTMRPPRRFSLSSFPTIAVPINRTAHRRSSYTKPSSR
jgi:hypothetical protein